MVKCFCKCSDSSRIIIYGAVNIICIFGLSTSKCCGFHHQIWNCGNNIYVSNIKRAIKSSIFNSNIFRWKFKSKISAGSRQGFYSIYMFAYISSIPSIFPRQEIHINIY